MASLSEKEILNQVFEEKQKHSVIDAEPDLKVEKEIQNYLQKAEEEQYLGQPIVDDYGQPLVSPPVPQEPKIILPISQGQYTIGLTQKFTESVRWLVAWCGRLIKILGKRAVFRESNK